MIYFLFLLTFHNFKPERILTMKYCFIGKCNWIKSYGRTIDVKKPDLRQLKGILHNLIIDLKTVRFLHIQCDAIRWGHLKNLNFSRGNNFWTTDLIYMLKTPPYPYLCPAKVIFLQNLSKFVVHSLIQAYENYMFFLTVSIWFYHTVNTFQSYFRSWEEGRRSVFPGGPVLDIVNMTIQGGVQ